MVIMQRLNQKILDMLRDTMLVRDKIKSAIVVFHFYILLKCARENTRIAQLVDYVLKNPEDTRTALSEAFSIIGEEYGALNEIMMYQDYHMYIDETKQYQLLLELSQVGMDSVDFRELSRDFLYQISCGNPTDLSVTKLEVSQLGIQLLDVGRGEFYDGTAGVGTTLIHAVEHAFSKGEAVKVFGQELQESIWKIGIMYLFLNDIDSRNYVQGDTIKNPMFAEGLKIKQFDYAMMDIPFGMRINNPEDIENDVYNRFLYGQPSRASGDMLFVSHLLKSLRENGRGVVTVTNGTLFRVGPEEMIRKNLIAADVIECVIGLGNNLCNGTSIPINMIVFNKNKASENRNKILFINAEELGDKVNRLDRVLSKEDIQRIVECYRNRVEDKEFSIVVDTRNLEDYNLLPTKYIIAEKADIEGYGEVKFDRTLIDAMSTTPFGKLGRFYRGINITSKDISEEDGYKVINLADVQDGKLNIDGLETYTIKNNARVEAYEVKAGDLIISSKGSNIKIAVIPEGIEDTLLSQNFIGFRPNGSVDSEYLKAYLESPLGQYLLQLRQTGTTILGISAKALDDLPVKTLEINDQRAVMKEFLEEEQVLNRRLQEIYRHLEDNKLKLYSDMGISETFKLKG